MLDNPQINQPVTSNVQNFVGYVGYIRKIQMGGRYGKRVNIWVEFPNHPWNRATNQATFEFQPNELTAVEKD